MNEFSIVVTQADGTRFEPYKGFDESKADAAFSLAAARRRAGSIVRKWEMTVDDGKVVKQEPPE